ncbi:hypothetical protein PsorP6_019068 [Peronosclerospora sorghi]|nr:hypothetical protein PsorP6_019068 [Peronosclerospora sorghi]
MYTAQKEEVCVAGIYVNFFNENQKNGIVAQIAGTVHTKGSRVDTLKPNSTSKKELQAAAAAAADVHVMHGLLAALSYDISGFLAHPQALESVLLQRLLPVAMAIRNVLHYTPDMYVQVLQADGIVTLCLGPRDATAGIFVCKCSAAATSLHGVHMLSFSGKCIDALATVVPPFIKSAFQVVYKNLARTEASMKGHLARITL